MVKLTIDGKAVEVKEDSTVLEAANEAGIYVPTLCYHESLSPGGSCRLCTVEIMANGKSGLAAACEYPVEPGLEISTDSPRVKEARRLAVELLLAQRPRSAKVQELAQKLGIEQPAFTLKEEECILCELCVRACHEIVGVDAITFMTRGKDRAVDEASVVHSSDKCIGCDTCAYVCPTEAITVEDVGDTRVLTTPSGKMEFKLKKCGKCGGYWAPEKQLAFIVEQYHLEPEIFDVCPDCRD